MASGHVGYHCRNRVFNRYTLTYVLIHCGTICVTYVITWSMIRDYNIVYYTSSIVS